ncbi:MAG: GNAT family N-acetyltransferase [Hyphomicrobiaceae bacterium]
MDVEIVVRAFTRDDARAVRDLFIRVNRLLAPSEMAQAFEDYIAASLIDEIDQIEEYYGARDGGFWIAEQDGRLVGMFGLEATSATSMELRRMYVDPDLHRRGVARKMLRHAEQECRKRKCQTLELSTSELQSAAIALYRSAGYQLVREEVALSASNKTLGGGIRRYHFVKQL